MQADLWSCIGLNIFSLRVVVGSASKDCDTDLWTNRSVCLEGKMCAVFLTVQHRCFPWLGCTAAHLATRPFVCFTFPGPDSSDSYQSEGARWLHKALLASGSTLASNALAGGDLLVDVCLSVAALATLGPADTSSRVIFLPPPGAPLYGLRP